MILEMPVRSSALLPCVFLLFASSPAWADDLRTLSGKTVSGTLASVTDKEVILTAKDSPIPTPLAQVLAIEIQPVKGIPAGTKYTDVKLLDDTLLHCKEFAFKGNTAHLTLTSGVALELPLAAIVWLVRDADQEPLRKKFLEFASKKSRGDQILVLRDGELNPLEGSLGNIDAQGKTIQFKRDGSDAIGVQLERLHGLVFFRPEGLSETPICKIYDREGNVLTAVKVSFKSGQWQLTTAFGATLPLAGDAVAKLDFNMGKLTYLSDLEPAKIVERSSIGLIVRYRKDANLDGNAIVLNQRYGKGLSMHAHTELEYNLAGKFKDLKGILGVDTRTGSDSQPRVTIYCDGEKRFSETVTAKEIRSINLNVKDVTVLKIVVSSRNELDLHDHVTFAEARVSQ